MSLTAPVIRDERGWFKPGTRPGPGVRKGTKGKSRGLTRLARDAKKAVRDLEQEIREGLDPHLPKVLTRIAEQAAGGCATSQALLLKYVAAPATPKTRITLEGWDAIPLEQKHQALADAAAAGMLDLQTAAAMAQLVDRQINNVILGPLRQLIREITPTSDPAQVLAAIANLVKQLDLVDEGAARTITIAPPTDASSAE